MKYDWYYVSLWIAWVGIGLVLEFIALLNNNPRTPPLTHLVIRYLPWLGVTFAAWLFVHFLRRALNRTYRKRLDTDG